MNGLEIMVLGVIAVCGLIGFFTGFLRAAYSLLAGILVLVFVTWATPKVTVFLEENTGFGQMIQEKCIDYIEEMAEEKIREGAEAYQDELQKDAGGVQSLIPEGMLEGIAGYAAKTAGEALQEAGLYEEIAGVIAHYILEGIAFLLMMLAGGILTHWLAHALDLASRFPALKGPDKILGAVFGMGKGLLLVWVFFVILTLLGGGKSGNVFLSSIEESRILNFLYQNNILLRILMDFLE